MEVYRIRPSWRYFWYIYPIVIVISMFLLYADMKFAVIVILLAAVLSVMVARYRWLYTITSEIIESREGIIARHITEIEVRDYRARVLHQSIFGRFLNYGDIEISSAADSGIKVVLFGVGRPAVVMGIIRDFRRRFERLGNE